MKNKRVIQMSFDIVISDDTPEYEIENLFNAVDKHIDSFSNKNGKIVGFKSVGIFNKVDFTEEYKNFDL